MAADGTDDDSEMAAAMAEMDAAGGADADDDLAAAMPEMDGEAGGGDDMAAAMAETDAGGGGAGLPGPGGDQAVYDVPVEISAVLGTAQIPVSQLLKMGRGAVLPIFAPEAVVISGDVRPNSARSSARRPRSTPLTILPH